jgi:dUTP pyrophosphatase
MALQNGILKVKPLCETARLPTRGSPLSAGYDVYSSEKKIVPAQGKALISTGISVAVEGLPKGENWYIRIAPRSGMAWKKHTDIGAGVVDMDYRGPVGVVMFNHSKEDLVIEVGDRIAQLIIEKIHILPVEFTEKLDDTVRGADGFGSTGK